MKIHIKILTLSIILFISVFLGFNTLSMPQAKGTNEPLSNFSALRAMSFVDVISKKPHPIGSREHAIVRDYLIQKLSEMGTNPSIETGFSENKVGDKEFKGRPENIIAKLQGVGENRKTVLLMAHYDTKPECPGASDNSTGCAVLLETVRALSSSAPLKNDIVFLFTDCEESGLLGSKMYYENLLKNKIDVVLNFEARGNSGPSIMFETGKRNVWSINEFKKSVQYPVAFSFTNTLYTLMPNNTDFSVFKKGGFNGYNFSLIGGLDTYHKSIDTPENLDKQSLQHTGMYALELTRHFGNISEYYSSVNDNIYFTAFKQCLIVYSEKCAIPFSIIAFLLLILFVTRGIKKAKFTLRGTFKGLLVNLAIITSVTVVSYIIWAILKLIYEKLSGSTLTIHTITSGFSSILFVLLTFITILALSICYKKLVKIIKPLEIITGAMVIWGVLSIVSSLCFTGVSYLFTWPLIFTLVGIFIVVFCDKLKSEIWLYIGFSLSVISIGILLIPFLYLTYLAFPAFVIYLHMMIITLIMGILIPFIIMIFRNKSIKAPLL